MKDRLSEIMRARGVKAAALAEALGCDPSTISKLVHSKRRLGEHWAKSFAPLLRTIPAAFYQDLGEAIPEMTGTEPRDTPSLAASAGGSVERAMGDRLRLTRVGLGYTIDGFAHRAGVVAVVVEAWERGERQPTVDSLIQLHQADGLSADWLLFGEYSALSGRLLQKILNLRTSTPDTLPARELARALPPSRRGGAKRLLHEQSEPVLQTIRRSEPRGEG